MYQTDADFRILFESNPLPMWVYDLATLRFLAVNEAAILHYGYSREEFLELTIKDIRPGGEVAALMPTVGRIKGIDKAGVWQHIRKDGSSILVEITSHGLTFQGRPAELILANDVSREHAALQALSENHFFFEKAQEVGNIGSWISDPNALGKLRWSLQTYRIFGLDPATKILVETFFSMVHPDDRKAVEAASQSALEGKTEFNIEHRIVRPDRSIRWVHEQANVERTANGTP